eukprot:119534_1
MTEYKVDRNNCYIKTLSYTYTKAQLKAIFSQNTQEVEYIKTSIPITRWKSNYHRFRKSKRKRRKKRTTTDKKRIKNFRRILHINQNTFKEELQKHKKK